MLGVKPVFNKEGNPCNPRVRSHGMGHRRHDQNSTIRIPNYKSLDEEDWRGISPPLNHVRRIDHDWVALEAVQWLCAG